MIEYITDAPASEADAKERQQIFSNLIEAGLYKRETEEWQGEVYEPILVILKLVLAVNDLMEEA